MPLSSLDPEPRLIEVCVNLGPSADRVTLAPWSGRVQPIFSEPAPLALRGG